MSIPVFCSYIRRKDMDSVLNCLVTDDIGPGEYLDRFQKASREAVGFDFGFAVRSPHSALGLALDAAGLEPGDAVAVSALSPAYYAGVLRDKRLEPVFVDVAQDSAAPSAQTIADAQQAAEKKPRAIVLFEALGVMPDPEAIRSLGLQVIEDTSQSLGAYRGETKAGTIGQMAILGLESGSLVTAGGGALLYAAARRDGTVLRNLAESLLPELRMTDFNAALGFAQLKELEASIAKRRELYGAFSQSLARTRHGLLSQEGEGEPAYWAFPVLLSSGMKDVRAYAKKKEVDTEPAFEGSLVGRGLVPEGSCPNARSVLMRALLFPLHQRVGQSGAQKISRVLATLP
ncbi:MAG TPA: DegT/DnrJ/EryC1/StrS family aminotransferase [Spirochaetia bacterium]|nr:DegT/DnrJ/EryC1/StrS family aminotransferase [Spirochaetia bacterium]